MINYKNYLKEIKNEIICGFFTKREIIKKIKNDLYIYTEENANLRLNDIVNHFGLPNDFAKGFNYSDFYLKKSIKSFLIIDIILSLVFIIVFLCLIINLINFINNYNGYLIMFE